MIKCANCGKEIHNGNDCLIVGDNFLQFHYFEEKGYVFCCDECLKEYLSVIDTYWEEDGGEDE